MLDEVSDSLRNARAYGWEVGKHGQLISKFLHVCPDNPFVDVDWAKKIDMNEKDQNA